MPRRLWVIIIGAAMCSTALGVLAIAKYGAVQWTDSRIYVSTAENLVRGAGFNYIWDGTTQPYHHFPPLFPLAIASVAALTGWNTFQAATWLNIALLLLNMLLMGALIARQAHSLALTGVLCLLLAVQTDWLNWHVLVLSEPLAWALVLTGLVLLAAYVDGGRWHWLIGAALCLGVATLARYAAISALVAAGVTLLIYRPGGRLAWPRLRQWGAAVSFGVVAGAPLLLWSLYNIGRGVSATNRSFGYVPLSAGEWGLFWRSVAGYLLPNSDLPSALVTLLLALPSLVLWVHIAARQHEQPIGAFIGAGWRAMPTLLHLLVGFAVMYVAFLFIARLFFDSAIGLDPRQLGMAALALLPVAAYGLRGLSAALWAHRIGRIALLALALLLLSFNLSIGVAWAFSRHVLGEGVRGAW